MRQSGTEQLASWSDTLAARLARSGRGDASVRPGLPRSIGSVERGGDLMAGCYLIGGELVNAPGQLLWDALPKSPEALREAHGFSWLDDLAAVPMVEAEALASAWTAAWIDRFGSGRGPGWTADLAGRRALRLLHHGESLAQLQLAPCLARHVGFLARRAKLAPPGLPRVEALAGLVHAALALDPKDVRADDALSRLDAAADALVGRDGGVASRSPEALARALLLLGWTTETAALHDRTPGPSLSGAIARGAPVLRGLVQPDGQLPRFHGGSGAPGLADAALALDVRRRTAAPATLAMGFARLRHGRTNVIMDAAAPPEAATDTAHASTLAIEVTVGRRPVIVNCGSGRRFGQRWGRAARATASHSTLSLDGFSSSRFGRDGQRLVETPGRVRLERDETETGTRLSASHDGYLATHGLWHERLVALSRDGRHLDGEDALVAEEDAAARRRFDRVRRSGPLRFAIRFHLDPAVEPSLDMGGRAVSVLLPSGALWVFRAASRGVRLGLEPSVCFPAEAFEPQPTHQIVLFSSADEYATRIAWQFAAVPGSGPLPRDTGT